MSSNNKNYIVEYNGEPVTRLSFEGNNANVTTGDIMDAIWYTADEAAECAAAIGTGAEAVRHVTPMKTTELIKSPCMIAVCAWCNKLLGLRPVGKGDACDGQLTHGICAECLKKKKLQLG